MPAPQSAAVVVGRMTAESFLVSAQCHHLFELGDASRTTANWPDSSAFRAVRSRREKLCNNGSLWSILSPPKATSIHSLWASDTTRRAFRREHPHVSATSDASSEKPTPCSLFIIAQSWSYFFSSPGSTRSRTDPSSLSTLVCLLIVLAILLASTEATAKDAAVVWRCHSKNGLSSSTRN